MRLEMAEFPVSSIKLGGSFQYHSGELTIHRAAIEQAVSEEKCIKAAWLEFVAPGNRGAEILERAFVGFHALPEPEQWWKVLGFDLAPKTRQEAEDAYRSLAKTQHPDVAGDAGKFLRIASAIERARQALG